MDVARDPEAVTDRLHELFRQHGVRFEFVELELNAQEAVERLGRIFHFGDDINTAVWIRNTNTFIANFKDNSTSHLDLGDDWPGPFRQFDIFCGPDRLAFDPGLYIYAQTVEDAAPAMEAIFRMWTAHPSIVFNLSRDHKADGDALCQLPVSPAVLEALLRSSASGGHRRKIFFEGIEFNEEQCHSITALDGTALLDIDACKFRDGGAALLGAIRANKGPTDLRFRKHLPLSHDNSIRFMEAFAQNTTLERFRLYGITLDDGQLKALVALVAGFRENRGITEFEYSRTAWPNCERIKKKVIRHCLDINRIRAAVQAIATEQDRDLRCGLLGLALASVRDKPHVVYFIMSELRDIVAKRNERLKEAKRLKEAELREQLKVVEEQEQMIEVKDAKLAKRRRKLEKRRREVNAQREAIEGEMLENGFEVEATSNGKRMRSEII